MAAEPELVVRARRAVVGGERAAVSVGVRDGAIAAVARVRRRRRRGRRPRARRRRGAAPRPGRHPRARQRARPHRVGGLRQRDPRGGGRRRHHDRRHAAQQHPADHDARGAGREARRRRGARPGSTSASGAAPCPATSPTSPASTRPGCSASSASCSTRASTSSRTSTPDAFRTAMAETARLGALMIVHAEDGEAIGECAARSGVRRLPREPSGRGRGAGDRAGPRDRPRHRWSRPRRAPQRVRGGPRRCTRPAPTGVDVSVETCPHYLHFEAGSIADGATELKCCPPIRDAANRDALWAALGSGDIDMVVSDHSPCTADLKRQDTGDFAEAWGGIASLQLGLPVVWTERPRARRTPHRRGPLDVDDARATGRAGRQGRDRRRRRRRPRASSRPTSRGPSTPRGCTTRTPSRPTPGVRSPAPSARPGSAGRRSTWPAGTRADGC